MNNIVAIDEETKKKLAEKIGKFWDRHGTDIFYLTALGGLMWFEYSLVKLKLTTRPRFVPAMSRDPRGYAAGKALVDIIMTQYVAGAVGGDVKSTVKGLLDDTRLSDRALVVLAFDTEEAATRFASIIAEM